mmetsp:Transcript_47165/g.79003  ORF Transcript_47165/g.79003 Transcript_47165/m.79003 type:complete len:223 (-) Transcript_47165:541-1209(-)
MWSLSSQEDANGAQGRERRTVSLGYTCLWGIGHKPLNSPGLLRTCFLGSSCSYVSRPKQGTQKDTELVSLHPSPPHHPCCSGALFKLPEISATELVSQEPSCAGWIIILPSRPADSKCRCPGGIPGIKEEKGAYAAENKETELPAKFAVADPTLPSPRQGKEKEGGGQGGGGGLGQSVCFLVTETPHCAVWHSSLEYEDSKQCVCDRGRRWLTLTRSLQERR